MTNATLNDWNGTSLGQSQLLIVIIVFLLMVVIGPLGVATYQLIKFKKMSFEKTYVTKWLLGIIFTTFGLSAIASILSFVFYFGGNFIKNYDTAKILVIVCIGFQAVMAIFDYAILIFANHYIAFGVSKEYIYVFGEVYPTKNAISLVLDKDAKKISVHISVGKRAVKRIRFSITSMCGQCLQSSAQIIGLPIQETEDKALYIAEVEKRQQEFRDSLTKRLAVSKIAQSSSKNSLSKASSKTKPEAGKEDTKEAASEK